MSGSDFSTDDAAPKRLKDTTTLSLGKEENGTNAERRHIEVTELDCSDDETEEEGREGPEAEEDVMQDIIKEVEDKGGPRLGVHGPPAPAISGPSNDYVDQDGNLFIFRLLEPFQKGLIKSLRTRKQKRGNNRVLKALMHILTDNPNDVFRVLLRGYNVE